MAPLFSVHCAAYNHARYVEETVRSVLDQTVADLEMVIVDDGSADDTWSRLQALEGDPRLRILRHGPGVNRGRAASLRLAIESSSGRYLARIDSDDRWLPDKLERQLPVLEAGRLLCYGRVRGIDEAGAPVSSEQGGGVTGTSPDELRAWVGTDPFEGLLLSNYLPALTVAFPRTAYQRVGGYAAHLKWEDYALWTRIAALDPPAFVDHPLAEHRIHAAQAGRVVLAAGRELHEDLAVIEHTRNWPDLPERAREIVDSWCRCYAAIAALIDGDWSTVDIALEREDAHRLGLLFKVRLPRLLELVSSREIRRWRRAVLGLGPPFDEKVGRLYRSHLALRLLRAYRGRRLIEAVGCAAAYSALGVSDRLRSSGRKHPG